MTCNLPLLNVYSPEVMAPWRRLPGEPLLHNNMKQPFIIVTSYGKGPPHKRACDINSYILQAKNKKEG